MQGGARGLAVRAVGLMPITVYVIDPDPDERTWIESALAPSVDAVVVLDDGAALLAPLGTEKARGPGGRSLALQTAVRSLRARLE